MQLVLSNVNFFEAFDERTPYDMTITISVPETLESADINLDVDIDPADSNALVVSYDSQTLPSTDSLIVECLVGQEIKLIVTDFTDSSSVSWTVNATPLVRATSTGTNWQRNSSTAVDSDDIAWPHGSNFVEVEVEGSANSGSSIRKRNIYIKMLTSDPGPGGL